MLGLVDILWKTEVIGELYLVQSADENVGGSVVVIFWVPEVIHNTYYVRSADENVGISVGVYFFCSGSRYLYILFVVGYGGREARAGRPKLEGS